MQSPRLAILVSGLALLATSAAFAVPTPEVSLNTCQDKARNEGKKFITNTVNAVGTCLKAVANDVIKNNLSPAALSSTTSKTCVAQLRKIYDTRTPPADKDLDAKFSAAVGAKCIPGFTANQTHVIDDITDHAAGLVSEEITTANIDNWCTFFGGDGSIDSEPEWEACMLNAHRCAAIAAIASAYPRALEWIIALQSGSNMGAVAAPATDPTRTSDAIAAAAGLQGLLDPDGDGFISPRCGGQSVSCPVACCYIENLGPATPETTCIQYEAPAASLGLVAFSCPGTSLPGGAAQQLRTYIPGPCTAGPNFGVPCGGPNLVVSKDGLCP